MPKLHQIIAIDRNSKAKYREAITEAHQLLQRGDQFNGLTRRYKPKDDEGELLPNEDKPITYKARQVVAETLVKLIDAMDIEATRDWANCEAKGTVELDGKVLLKDAPVSFLLALERKLIDVRTFIEKLPVLATGEEWSKDTASDFWATKPVESVKTKKVPRPLVLAEATKEHPAQVKEAHEDVITGYWTTTKYSSAYPASEINAMLDRVEKLQRAVKFARSTANESEAKKIDVAKGLFDFIFAPGA